MTPDITWFTPSVGVTSTEMRFIQLFYKSQFSSAHSTVDPFNSLKPCTQLQASVHIATDLLITIQKPSAHTAAEVVHTHSWDLTFPYKIALVSP